jgi:hypothetical protein
MYEGQLAEGGTYQREETEHDSPKTHDAHADHLLVKL